MNNGIIKYQTKNEAIIFKSILDTIFDNYNNYSIIFKFNDVIIRIFNTIFFEYEYLSKEYKGVYLLNKNLKNGNFKIDTNEKLKNILEVNTSYFKKYNDGLNQIKQHFIEILKKYNEYLSFIFIDYQYEEIQVINIVKIKEIILENQKKIYAFLEHEKQPEKFNEKSVDFYINELSKMYNNAPKGYQMTMVHLFGIKYSDQLKKLPIKKIAVETTGRESLYVEIGKGMKLSKYVTIKNSVLNGD